MQAIHHLITQCLMSHSWLRLQTKHDVCLIGSIMAHASYYLKLHWTSDQLELVRMGNQFVIFFSFSPWTTVTSTMEHIQSALPSKWNNYILTESIWDKKYRRKVDMTGRFHIGNHYFKNKGQNRKLIFPTSLIFIFAYKYSLGSIWFGINLPGGLPNPLWTFLITIVLFGSPALGPPPSEIGQVVNWKKAFWITAPMFWNSLPREICWSSSVAIFFVSYGIFSMISPS